MNSCGVMEETRQRRCSPQGSQPADLAMSIAEALPHIPQSTPTMRSVHVDLQEKVNGEL